MLLLSLFETIVFFFSGFIVLFISFCVISKLFEVHEKIKMSNTDSISKLNPGLYLVATPIGNLKDITIRAIETLKNSHVIYCENTIHSQKLLREYNIEGKIIKKYTDHDFKKLCNVIQKQILEKKIISLISDAGSPLISDPGTKLVEYLIHNNVHVESIPGPSSIIPAMQLQGIHNDLPFLFMGFLDKKVNRKKIALEKHNDVNLIFFSTVPQLLKDLDIVFELFPNAEVVILNELTKKFEKVLRLNKDNYNKEKINLKGEIVVIFNAIKKETSADNLDNYNEDLIKYGFKKTFEKVKSLGIRRNDLYKQYVKIKV